MIDRDGCDPYDDPDRACYWGPGTDENGEPLNFDDEEGFNEAEAIACTCSVTDYKKLAEDALNAHWSGYEERKNNLARALRELWDKYEACDRERQEAVANARIGVGTP